MPQIESFFESINSPTGEFVDVPKSDITSILDEDTLQDIGRKVIEGMDNDKDTMTDWKNGVERGRDLVKLEESTKDTPVPNAANFKSPILMTASLKWSDRASTELLRGDNLAKPKNIGEDPENEKVKRGNRVANFLNFQINEEMEEWRDDHGRMIYNLPYDGTVFKKVFYDPVLGRNVSNLVVYPNFIVNNNASSVARLPRFSELFELNLNEVEERKRAGIWRDVELNPDEEKPDPIQKFVEQYGWYDLDEDGYKEPYVFVVHISSQKVVRVMPRFELNDVTREGKITRIKPLRNIVKYGFLYDPCGGLLDVGYSHILASLTEGINTSTNLLVDAGKFANMQGGFLAKGFRRRKGQLKAVPGVYHPTDMDPALLANSVFPYQFKEPSPTLFQLMQFMIIGAQELSASADLSKALGTNAPATTTLALVQEQQLSASAIILRVYRSMSEEFSILYKLTGRFGDPETYNDVLDDPEANFETDFENKRTDFVPVANPELSSRVQRIQQATAELQNIQAVSFAGGDIRPVVRNFYDALGTQNIEEIFPDLSAEQQLQKLIAQNPELAEIITQEQQRAQMLMNAQLEAEQRKEAREELQLQLDVDKNERENIKAESEVVLNLEKAETEETKNQIDVYTQLKGQNSGTQ